MRLFNRNTKQSVPAELEPYTTGRSDWRLWVRRVVVFIIMLAVLAAIVWAAARVYSNITDDGSKDDTPLGTSSEKQSDTSDKTDKAAPKSNNATPKSTGGSTAPAPAQTPATIPATGDESGNTPATLPSTGG